MRWNISERLREKLGGTLLIAEYVEEIHCRHYG